MYTIYRIVNKTNKKCYIGVTRQQPPEKRFQEHLAEARKTRRNSYLYNSMRKYGIEKFSFEILCWGDDNKAGIGIAEPLLIGMLKPEYNMTQGGDGVDKGNIPWNKGLKAVRPVWNKGMKGSQVAWNKGQRIGPSAANKAWQTKYRKRSNEESR